MSSPQPTSGIERAVGELVAAIRAELAAHAASPAPVPERLLSIDEAADALGIGRTALYHELTAGRLRSFKVGRRRLVPTSATTAFIEALARGEGGGPA